MTDANNSAEKEVEISGADSQLVLDVARRAVAAVVKVKGNSADTNTIHLLSISGLNVPMVVCETDDANERQVITLGGKNDYLRVVMGKTHNGDLRFSLPDDGLKFGENLLDRLKDVGASNGALFQVYQEDGQISSPYQMLYDNGGITAFPVN